MSIAKTYEKLNDTSARIRIFKTLAKKNASNKDTLLKWDDKIYIKRAGKSLNLLNKNNWHTGFDGL